MDKKTLAFVSYIFTPIGWLISYFSYKGQEKDSFVAYHLKQSFGLFITWLVVWVAMMILMAILGAISFRLVLAISFIYWLVWLGFIVLMIIGIINANSGEEKPLPIIGKMFEGKFNFIQ